MRYTNYLPFVLLTLTAGGPHMFAPIPARAQETTNERAASEGRDTEPKTMAFDPSGTWRWHSQRSGQVVKHQIMILAEADGQWTATYSGLLDNLPATIMKLTGNQISAQFESEINGIAFQANYQATLAGDRAVGKVSFTTTQGTTQSDWRAERTVELSDVVGQWTIAIEANGTRLEPQLSIQAVGNGYEATYESANASQVTVHDLRVENKLLMFTVTGKVSGGDIQIDFSGRPYGNHWSGKAAYDFSGNKGTLPYVAERTGSANFGAGTDP